MKESKIKRFLLFLLDAALLIGSVVVKGNHLLLGEILKIAGLSIMTIDIIARNKQSDR